MQRRFARTFLSNVPAPRLLASLLLGTLVLAGLLALGARAQDGEEQFGFVRYIEGLLSTPDRRVSLHGVEGVFSWHPKVERIEVADSEGVWLQLEGVEAAWTRAALLRRILDVQVLRAARVVVHRRPVAAGNAETGGASPPPVEIVVDSIALPQVVLGPAIAGAEAELAAAGAVRLTQEALSAQVAIDRQDRAGTLTADLRFDRANEALAADLALEEPAGGILSEMLQLRGRPALNLTLSGSGPLDQWAGNLEMQADRSRVASGAMSVTRLDRGYRLRGKLAAALETLVPQDYAALVAGESGIDLDLTRFDDGRIEVASGSLKSEGLDLTASGVLGADMVPQSAEVSLSLGQAGRAALPFLPGELSLAGLRADASLGGDGGGSWQVALEGEGAEADFGDIGVFKLNGSGTAERLADKHDRSATFSVEGSADGVALADPALNDAVGSSLGFNGAGRWSAGQPALIESFQAILSGLTAGFNGTATRTELSGQFSLAVDNLSRFAKLAERPALSGEVRLQASGIVAADRTFDLKLDGQAGDLTLGIAMVDPLLKGATRTEGGLAKRGDAVSFDGLTLTNQQAHVEADGSVASGALDLTVRTDLADLALVTPRASGAARIGAEIGGTQDAPRIEATASGENLVLMGRPLKDATARFSGVVAGPATSGEAEIAGTLGSAPLSGSARLSAGEEGTRRLDGFQISVGESRIAGDVALLADGLLTGEMAVVSPDLSKVAPLFLVDASGMLRGKISLAAEGGVQSAAFSGTATDIVYEDVTLESADIQGRTSDLFGAPQIDGSFSLRNMKAGGLAILSATGTAARLADSTAVSVDARLADGSAKLQGTLEPDAGGLAIGLQSFSYARPGLDLALAQPTTIAVRDGVAEIGRTSITAGSGQVVISGRAGSQIDISATLERVPAALANAFAPNLGAEGSVSGTVTASGPAASPDARLNLTLANASVTASRNAGLGPLAITADGTLARNVLTLKSHAAGAGGLAIDVAGTVGTAAPAPLNLKVTGSVPLGLGNAQLASRGAALEGSLAIDIAVSGTASNPQYSGRVTSEGGGFVDPATGIVLRNLQLAANVSGQRIVVERLSATSGEGTVSGSGSIGLDPNAGFPVDLTIKVAQARYVDGTLVASRFDADLKLSGTFAAGPLLQGTVFLDRTEITVPERLPRDSVAVDVKHVDPPAPVEQTLQAMRRPEGRSSRGGPPSAGIRLDVSIRAPQQIFVRGRGFDAEFGGQLRLAGATSALVASGAFTMNRGRLDILTRRITFDRGIITFAGDLDPMLDFSGTTRSGDVNITATVSGRASDPQVVFSSTPELPQDEILARLIFQKGIGELSPLQVARLAAAASELTGGSGGVLARLRRSTGLDDLDIVTDEKGQTSVAAGRYVTENVYLGVQQGASAESSRVTIDLDVTKNVKARAGMSAEGSSSLGIFFEKEY